MSLPFNIASQFPLAYFAPFFLPLNLAFLEKLEGLGKSRSFFLTLFTFCKNVVKFTL